jgi:HPt (histidine-containing phosphotransfer) domain-containing protein
MRECGLRRLPHQAREPRPPRGDSRALRRHPGVQVGPDARELARDDEDMKRDRSPVRAWICRSVRRPSCARARRRDSTTVKRLAHQLKGAAGGYGFAGITDAAKDVERAIVEDALDAPSLQRRVETLADLCRRARARRETHADSVSRNGPPWRTPSSPSTTHPTSIGSSTFASSWRGSSSTMRSTPRPAWRWRGDTTGPHPARRGPADPDGLRGLPEAEGGSADRADPDHLPHRSHGGPHQGPGLRPRRGGLRHQALRARRAAGARAGGAADQALPRSSRGALERGRAHRHLESLVLQPAHGRRDLRGGSATDGPCRWSCSTSTTSSR